jgi:hypothetical protein
METAQDLENSAMDDHGWLEVDSSLAVLENGEPTPLDMWIKTRLKRHYFSLESPEWVRAELIQAARILCLNSRIFSNCS